MKQILVQLVWLISDWPFTTSPAFLSHLYETALRTRCTWANRHNYRRAPSLHSGGGHSSQGCKTLTQPRRQEGIFRRSIDVSRKLRAKTTQRGGNEPVDLLWMLFLSLLWCFFLRLVSIHELSGHMRIKSFLKATSSTPLSYGVFGEQYRKN